MNISPNTSRPRKAPRSRRKLTPGTCHMMRDGRILTTAEARRLFLKRFWNDTSGQKKAARR